MTPLTLSKDYKQILENALRKAEKNKETLPEKLAVNIVQTRAKTCQSILHIEQRKNPLSTNQRDILMFGQNIATEHAKENGPQDTQKIMSAIMKASYPGEILTADKIIQILDSVDIDQDDPALKILKQRTKEASDTSSAFDTALIHLVNTAYMKNGEDKEKAITELKVFLAILKEIQPKIMILAGLTEQRSLD